jgi:hypothetical protein
MFDWFKGKKGDGDNVVPFPERKGYIPQPELPEEKPMTYYRLGITNNNRVSFQMGYSEITMNKEGVENLIRQLQVFRDQLAEDTEE